MSAVPPGWRWPFSPCCLQERLEEQARCTPDAPAVSFEDGSCLTYQELHRRAEVIATTLRSYGLGPNDLVGVRVDRSIGLVVALLGVLKAGAAYVAIDPSFPMDRQNYILQDAGAKVLIVTNKPTTDPSYNKKEEAITAPNVRVLKVGPLGDLISPRGNNIKSKVGPGIAKQDPRSLAYVLYTSGSTGKPKGVLIEHLGVVNLLEHFHEELALTPSDVVLGFTTFCFDISVLEIFLPIMIGARLHMVSAATQKDAGALVDIIEDPCQGITFVQATPATFEMLMHFGWKGNPRVQCLCGGEAFRLNLGPLVSRCKAFRNGYGPTEATIYSTVYKLPGPPTENVPIGGAVSAYTLHILDTETLKFVGEGEAGELFIGGIGLARGYHNRPDLTAEKFIPNPFGEGRLYRTGDLCKWRKGSEATNDGVVLYLGRLDSQVKINGYRIELGEVEESLQTHPDVGAAVVLAREDVTPTGAKALVAYVKMSADSKGDFDEDAFKAHLSRNLPHYMVPRFWVHMTDFPFSPNGKIDRKALKAPSHYYNASSGAGTASSSATTSPIKPARPVSGAADDDPHTMAVVDLSDDSSESPLVPLVCRSILSVSGSEVTADSALASVGIDSLGSMVLVRRLSEACGGVRIPVALLYQLGTVRNLGLYLHNKVLESGDKATITRLHLDSNPTLTRKASLTSSLTHLAAASSTTSSLTKPSSGAPPTARLLMAGLPTLQGLRGLLILWVVFEHYMDRAQRGRLGWRMSANTFLFVLLSGLSCFFQAQPAASKGQWRWLPFLRSRAVGIFPIYYVAILLSLPRYLGVTMDDEAYAGSGWTKTGIMATNYSSPTTYVVDGVLYLTGMQTWVAEVNHRGLNSLYYASVQWNLYLLFAVAVWMYQLMQGRVVKKTTTHTPTSTMSFTTATALYAVGAVGVLAGLYCYIEFRKANFIVSYCPTVFLPCFTTGLITAWYFTHLASYTSPNAPVWWNVVPRSWRRGTGAMVVGRVWAHTMDALAAAIVFIVLEKHWAMQPRLDHALYLIVLPIMTSVFVVMLLLSPTDRRVQPTALIKIMLESDWAQILGKLSFAIYLFHEVIGDVYMQFAVKQLYSQWHGMLPPLYTPWYIKYQLYMEPWMSTQSFVLKLSALSLSVMVAWLVTTYLTDGVVLDAFVQGGALVEWLKTRLCSSRCNSSSSSSSSSSTNSWDSGSSSLRGGGLPTTRKEYRARCSSSDGEGTSFLAPKSVDTVVLAPGAAVLPSPKENATAVTFLEEEADKVV